MPATRRMSVTSTRFERDDAHHADGSSRVDLGARQRRAGGGWHLAALPAPLERSDQHAAHDERRAHEEDRPDLLAEHEHAEEHVDRRVDAVDHRERAGSEAAERGEDQRVGHGDAEHPRDHQAAPVAAAARGIEADAERREGGDEEQRRRHVLEEVHPLGRDALGALEQHHARRPGERCGDGTSFPEHGREDLAHPSEQQKRHLVSLECPPLNGIHSQ
jgi:hypothetical protein